MKVFFGNLTGIERKEFFTSIYLIKTTQQTSLHCFLVINTISVTGHERAQDKQHTHNRLLDSTHSHARTRGPESLTGCHSPRQRTEDLMYPAR